MAEAEPGGGGVSSRRNATERRNRIISAARMLFASHGFHSTGMAQIARESDVQVGQIYRDFRNKEDVITAIVRNDLASLLDEPELSSAIASGDEARLRAWIVALIARRPDLQSCRLFADIISEAARNPRIAEILAQAQNRVRERLGMALEALAPPQDAAGRAELVDYIFALSGAVLHRYVCVPGGDHGAIVARLVALVNLEIDRLRPPSA